MKNLEILKSSILKKKCEVGKILDRRKLEPETIGSRTFVQPSELFTIRRPEVEEA